MDVQYPAECGCGSQHFERIIVTCPGGRPYRTDFVACAEGRVMFHVP